MLKNLDPSRRMGFAQMVLDKFDKGFLTVLRKAVVIGSVVVLHLLCQKVAWVMFEKPLKKPLWKHVFRFHGRRGWVQLPPLPIRDNVGASPIELLFQQ